MRLSNNTTAELLDQYHAGAKNERSRIIGELRELQVNLRERSNHSGEVRDLYAIGAEDGFTQSANEVHALITKLEQQ